MIDSILVDKLVSGVRKIGTAGVPDLEASIENYLNGELAGVAPSERLRLLEALAGQFGTQEPIVNRKETEATEDIIRLMSLFLGKTLNAGEISSHEMAEKFAGSLNTLFDTLNQIITIINVTLLGQSPELETIRKVIGSNIEGGTTRVSVEEYLDQIQRAFLVAHQAFQQTTATLIGEVLSELDPEALSKSNTSGLKFGPLRKAELFEKLEGKYARCKRWYNSGEYKERMLREFERCCQQTFKSRLG
jgi:hypothetical protein